MTKKIRFYAQKNGCCNICGEFNDLTFDHVPPKGCVGIQNRNVALLTNILSCGKLSKKNTRQFQNGLKFRSLCSKCNNTLLGVEYDPFLNDFASKVSNYVNLIVKYDVSLPKSTTIQINVQRVVRAIVGHLLAAQVREDMSKPIVRAPYLDAIRDFFLNPCAPIPKELEVYYWLYPSDIQVIILGSGVMDINNNKRKAIVGDFIKFYPIAFWVTWDQPSVDLKLSSLCKNKDLQIDELVNITISTHNIPRIDWPEHPGDDEIVLLNDEVAYYAKKKRRLMKR